MNSYPINTIKLELMSDAPLSAGTLAYLEERAKNTFYDYVLDKFKEAEKLGMTKASLARRMGKKPDHVSKILGSPGNWTLGMISALLAAISNEELFPCSLPFEGRSVRND